MAQIRGTAGYHLGSNQSSFAGPSSMGNMGRSEATNDPSPLDAIREQTSKIEDWLDTMSDPIKPYLPAIGRFLIVVTFLEDALRIITQWGDQLVYLHDYRHSKPIPPQQQGTQLETWVLIECRSSQRDNTPLPRSQRHRHDHLLDPHHHPQTQRIRRHRAGRRRRDPSPRLRPHLRPQLLPAQPQRHGRPAHGPLRQLGAEEVRPGRSTADRREGSQDVLPACWASVADFPLHRVCVCRGLEFREGDCDLHWAGGVCDGCGGLQGQVECDYPGHDLEYLQYSGE